jgi:hypothetical protein
MGGITGGGIFSIQTSFGAGGFMGRTGSYAGRNSRTAAFFT